MADTSQVDELAKEIGERLVPDIEASQIIPADAVFVALGEEQPQRPPAQP